MSAAAHVSVMPEEALDGLNLRADGVYVDATYGNGGHSRAILSRIAGGRLIALDVDPSVTPLEHPAFLFVRANFRDLRAVLDDAGIDEIDGVLFDFGVSSMQLDRAERGFSFTAEAPLDMRMDQDRGEGAYDLLSAISETKLADLIFAYGEERAARRIARALIRMRDEGRLPATTTALAATVAGVLQRPGKRERVHPATRTFQALRIAVNDELGAITDGLDAALASLKIGGRAAAISFHSLEDRIVKRCFRDDPRAEPVTRKPLSPTLTEIQTNPRSRSARLRIAERVEVPC